MLLDLRFAVRQLLRTPLFSAALIVVIGIGISVNAVMYTVYHYYTVRPPAGIPADPSIVRLWATRADTGTREIVPTPFSYADIVDLRQGTSTFAEVGAWVNQNAAMDFGTGPETAIAIYATDNYFRALGVEAAMGSTFPETGERSGEPIVVISDWTWQTRFGGEKTVIGKTFRLDGQLVRIVGVAPRLFVGAKASDLNHDRVWIPLGARATIRPEATGSLERRSARNLQAFARLRRGVDVDEVRSLVGPIATRIAQADPRTHDRFVVAAEPMVSGGAERERRNDAFEMMGVWIVIGTLVVAITCTNVSALLLGRAVARRREIGVRLSLGAGRLRIVRQMLTECFVISIAASVLSLVLYLLTTRVLYATIPDLAYAVSPQLSTLAFTGVFALVTTVVFGLAPALHASRESIADVIKSGGSHHVKRSRLQSVFVVAQLASSQPVLIVAAITLLNVRQSSFSDVAKAPTDVAMFTADPLTQLRGFPIDQVPDSVAGRWRDRIAALPRRAREVQGVRTAGLATRLIFDHFSFTSGDLSIAEGDGSDMRLWFATPGYVETMQLPIIRGRGLTAEDDIQGSRVAIVNEEVARRLWPNADPIGRRIVKKSRVRDDDAGVTLEVIGVVGHAAYSAERERPSIYVPFSTVHQLPPEPILAVQTTGPARPFMTAVRGAVREIEPALSLTPGVTIADQYARQNADGRNESLGALGIGLAALGLASLGLYGVIAFGVAQRTREIGIRLAVGASPREVVRHFFNDGMRVTLIGSAIGLPLALIGMRVAQAGFLRFHPESWLAVALVIPALFGIAALASWLPARRAAAVDPLIALRAE